MFVRLLEAEDLLVRRGFRLVFRLPVFVGQACRRRFRAPGRRATCPRRRPDTIWRGSYGKKPARFIRSMFWTSVRSRRCWTSRRKAADSTGPGICRPCPAHVFSWVSYQWSTTSDQLDEHLPFESEAVRLHWRCALVPRLDYRCAWRSSENWASGQEFNDSSTRAGTGTMALAEIPPQTFVDAIALRPPAVSLTNIANGGASAVGAPQIEHPAGCIGTYGGEERILQQLVQASGILSSSVGKARAGPKIPPNLRTVLDQPAWTSTLRWR